MGDEAPAHLPMLLPTPIVAPPPLERCQERLAWNSAPACCSAEHLAPHIRRAADTFPRVEAPHDTWHQPVAALAVIQERP